MDEPRAQREAEPDAMLTPSDEPAYAPEMRAKKPSSIKRLLKAAVSASLLGGLLFIIARKEGLGSLWARATGLDPLDLLAAVGLQFASVAVSVARWRILLRAQGIALPYARLTRSFLIGRFFGVFTPSTAGLDVYRAVDVGRLSGQGVQSAGAVVVEKLFGLLSLALLTFALLPLGGARFLGGEGLFAGAVVGFSSGVGLTLLRKPDLLAPLVSRLPLGVRDKVDGAVRAMTERPLGPAATAQALALGVAAHLSVATMYAASARALGVDVPAIELVLVGTIIVLATLVPVSIAGVGVREGAAVALLTSVGVAPSEALLVGVLGFLATQPPALVGGLMHLGASAREAGPTGSAT
jgi:uncharacterized membrane protein YbhN (UPF0104 family)